MLSDENIVIIDSKDLKKEMSDSSSNDSKLKLGICAMAKKVASKHMKSILQQLTNFGEFNLIIFDEKFILKEDIEVRNQ